MSFKYYKVPEHKWPFHTKHIGKKKSYGFTDCWYSFPIFIVINTWNVFALCQYCHTILKTGTEPNRSGKQISGEGNDRKFKRFIPHQTTSSLRFHQVNTVVCVSTLNMHLGIFHLRSEVSVDCNQVVELGEDLPEDLFVHLTSLSCIEVWWCAGVEVDVTDHQSKTSRGGAHPVRLTKYRDGEDIQWLEWVQIDLITENLLCNVWIKA